MAFTKEIGIDLGTANLLIYVKGEGIVIDEPSVVAIDAKTKRCLAAGQEAKDMLGRTPGKILAIRPLKDGVIADYEITEMMLDFFLKKLSIKGMFRRPVILICCPTNITSVERSAIRDTAYRAGAKKVFIEEEPKVAAVGAGLDIGKPNGCMVVDIGGGTCDIAVLSLGDIVTSSSLKVAGDTFDSNIVKFVKDEKKLLIGDRTAEQIKKTIGTAWPQDFQGTMEVSGRDLITGLPNTITISSEEISGSISDCLSAIVRSCKSVLEQTPPELASDIITRGVVLTGGGALLNGMDVLLRQELKVPVYIADSPLNCVAEGCGILLDNLSILQ